ncbi:hypothetical protein GWO43_07345 [candidate division KSB1 bacterium]|nr:hypothetical protein [candidate division KSB1 bacterium]NIR72975.1 hypothetical protein [candidate division KSB1 bacterium]NIS23781.1 hypothetical protein [candidate division KSB1 bacterium]NIT70700.1 hypothetical protein [candidate division KSB1 bacterium]NIU24431.1 hypothetical protein [candidate division KSB1 bacterium]
MKNLFNNLLNKDTGQNDNRMTVEELTSRFPEIPKDLYKEPVLREYAATFGNLLRQAQDPSACSQQYSVGNHFYLKLIGPMKIYMYGLSTKDKVLQQLQEMLKKYAADPEGFIETLLPKDIAEREVKGPGCE